MNCQSVDLQKQKNRFYQIDIISSAIDSGNEKIIENELRLDPSIINQKNSRGQTPLIQACINGNLEIVTLLLTHNPNLDLKSDDDLNALLYTALYGHGSILEILLREGAADNISYEGRNAKNLYSYLYLEEDSEEDYIYSFMADIRPKIISEIDLRRFYPEEAKKLSIKNKTVLVQININEKGVLRDVKILDSPNPLFNLPALQIVKRLRYTPAILDNKPIKVKMRIPINFSIED
jgi:TonB family protein